MLEIRELEKNQENFESKFSSFLISRNKISNEISVIVNKIINEVREDGDQALRKITKRLDDFDCPTFQVTETEINTALKSFDKDLLHSFEFAFEQLSYDFLFEEYRILQATVLITNFLFY